MSNLSNKVGGSAGGGGGGASPVLHVREEQASGVNGSATVAGWNTRVLNTIKKNTITGASVATNIITLPAGTYDFACDAVGYVVSGHLIRLYDITNAASIDEGMLSYAAPSSADSENATNIRISQFVLTGITQIRIEHYATGASSVGLGAAAAPVGSKNIYLDALFTKVA